MSARVVLSVRDVHKTFVLHQRGGLQLPVLAGASFDGHAGECVALDGPSGSGKSTLLKLVHANYRASAGTIRVHDASDRTIDVTHTDDRALVAMRRDVVSYVSQFLRAIPRVGALDVVAEPLVDDAGDDREAMRAAREQAMVLLLRLRIPQRLWHLPPATFSGGEQQRVNIARGLVKRRPLLLLDEPTASLDAANRDTVVQLVREARAAGSAVLGIFHDAGVRDAIADRVIDVGAFR